MFDDAMFGEPIADGADDDFDANRGEHNGDVFGTRRHVYRDTVAGAESSCSEMLRGLGDAAFQRREGHVAVGATNGGRFAETLDAA